MRMLKMLVAVILTAGALRSPLSRAQEVSGSAQPMKFAVPAKEAKAGKPAGVAAADQAGREAQKDPAPVPQEVIYRFFFMHMSTLEQVAAENEKKGDIKNAALWRSHDWRTARLSEAEGQRLSQIAKEFNRAVKDQDTRIQAFIDNYRDSHPNGEFLRLPVPQELILMQEEETRIINSYVDRLRATLGEDSFKKLDDYVRTSFEVKTVSVPAPQDTGVAAKPQGEDQ